MYNMFPHSPVAVAIFFLFFAPCKEYGVAMISASENLSESDEVVASKNLNGHLRPFGESGPNLEIEVRTDFPQPAEFWENYVQRLKPLKMSGVAQDSRAVRLWTDDYLLALDVPSDSFVRLETRKKENRQQETAEVHFHQFLKTYNHTEYYMVDDVPPYLSPDVMVPCGLQCSELMEKGLAMALMWFSSGGTKSVIHTDAFDNINCLIRGEKAFVLVDPARDREKIELKTDGSYSDIDVDSVDLTKYPDVAKMEFYRVNMTAGDCLYIPYRWIHQVRSYNSNVAINFWWDHYATVNLLQEQESVCQGQCDPSLTLDQVHMLGLDSLVEDFQNIRDWLQDAIINGPVREKSLVYLFEESALASEAENIAKTMFKMLDQNRDGLFTPEEHAQMSVETWKELQGYASFLMSSLKRAEENEEELDLRDEL